MSSAMDAHRQRAYDVRCEWGQAGLEAVGEDVAAVVIVDVLSFSTAVDVAVSRQAQVLPFRWRDDSASAYARQHGAQVARPRGEAGGLSLSPASLMRINAGTRLVLPSPNGSTLSLQPRGPAVFAGCLRNARAVADAANALGRPVAVIPAGERWPDGTLRPAVEDLVGAGAILRHLAGAASPEARAAIGMFEQFAEEIEMVLFECASGRELADNGYAEDVRIASELDVSDAVPRLADKAYVHAAPMRDE